METLFVTQKALFLPKDLQNIIQDNETQASTSTSQFPLKGSFMFKTSQFQVNSIGKKMNSCAVRKAKFKET